MDTDKFEDSGTIVCISDDDTSESKSQYDSTPHQFDEKSTIIIDDDDDDDDSLGATIISKTMEIKNKLNKLNLTETPKQKMTGGSINEVFKGIEIPDKQKLISKNKVPTGEINTYKNENFSNQMYSSAILSNEKNSQPLSISSSATFTKFKSIAPKIDTIQSSNPIYLLQTKSSCGPKSETYEYVGSHDDINCMMGNPTREYKGRSLYHNFSTSSKVNVTDNFFETSKRVQDNQPKTASEFVAQMQQLPGGKYKVVPSQGQVPTNLENLFKRNSHFIKHKMISGSTSSHTSSNTNNIQLGSQVSFGKSSKPHYFDEKNRNIKLVPHTVTSKDAIENLKNIIDDDQVQTKIRNQELPISPGLILSSKSQPDGQLFNVARHDKTAQNFHNSMQVSINDRSKNLLTQSVINSDNANCSINTDTTDDIVNGSEVTKLSHTYEEMIGKIKKELKELNDENDDNYETAGKFVSCHHKYCFTLIYEPELIDGLYCSETCKNMDTNQITVTDESDSNAEKNTNAHPKSVVAQSNCLLKLEDKTHCIKHKRKQSFITPCLEKMPRNDARDDVEHTVENSVPHHTNNNTRSNIILDENKSSESVSDQIKTTEVEVEDEDMIFDLENIVTDETILNYMEEMQFKAASNHLFNNPFPTEKNLFEVGQKLEGIDPEHKSLFCVLTIVQVCGYRIKLHFDGYPDNYNFWANADCPDLFYPGWCQKNLRILQPPKNFEGKFDWPSYLWAKNAYPAPKRNFASTKILANCKPHLFRVGYKLEVLDVLTRTLPKQIVCVGTIADIIGNRIRIHYDGWSDDYDYWMDMTSTNIHPVGWCEENGRSLARPSGYNDGKGRKPFSWTKYLKETNSKPVPEDAFVPRPLRDFNINTTIEVVDVAYPSLIRAAEITNVRGDELQILYDGFDKKYAYWVEDDSPNIHPIGWSVKTNHPIEIPADEHCRAGCKIQGCNGKGNTNNSNLDSHLLVGDCPYEFDSWEHSVTGLAKPLNRLHSVKVLKKPADSSSTCQTTEKEEKNNSNTTACNNLPNHNKEKTDRHNPQFIAEHTDSNGTPIKRGAPANINKILCNDICEAFGFCANGGSSTSKISKTWTKHNSQLGIPMYNTTDARNWTCLEVATFVDQVVTNNYSHQNVQGNIDVSQRFLEQEIDGDAFLMLTQREIMNKMKIPFGPALKIHSALTMLRQRVPVFDLVEANSSQILFD